MHWWWPPAWRTLAGLLVGVVHLCIYALMLLLPLAPCWIAWAVHVLLSLSLLVHWKLNNDICILTIVECLIRGVPPQRTLARWLLDPLLAAPNAVAYATVLLCCVSIARLAAKGITDLRRAAPPQWYAWR